MKLAEKAALCSGKDNWSTKNGATMCDGPHGLRREVIGEDGKPHTQRAVCFPNMCLLAASFDVDLAREYGAFLAKAATAAGVGALLAPAVNIKRSALCGRNFEYFSEDPLLCGLLGAAIIDGLQRNGVGAVLKHFALNGQEKARQCYDSLCTKRAKREIYYAPFEIAVAKSSPWAVMTAYNKIDGEYCSQNAGLINGVLRGEWGFDGLVMSDWGGVHDRVKALLAGLDLEMPFSGGFRDREIERAAKRDVGVKAALDKAAERVAAFAEKSEYGKAAKTAPPDAAEARAFARRAARESLVLLKNDGALLPLAKTAKMAVLGAFAETPRYQGGGAANVRPERLTGFCGVLAENGVDHSFSEGYAAEAETPDEALIAQAAETARMADCAAVFVGTPVSYESEGYDRPHMRLPEAQNRLIEAVAAANAKTAVVVFGGGAVEMPWANAVGAVMFAYLPGQEGSYALYDCLFGDFSPCGKLPETFPLKWEDAPCGGCFGAERGNEYREGVFVGYRYFATAGVKPLFPFGHGLSYSAFEYGGLTLEKTAQTVTARFEVKNVGAVAAAETAQVYVAPPERGFRPALELKAFRKVCLKPGETARITVSLTKRDFARYDEMAGDWRVDGGAYGVLVGASSADLRLCAEAAMEGDRPRDRETPLIMNAEEFHTALGRKPPVYAPWPFSRDSALGELRVTFIGRALYNAVVKGATGGNAGEQEGQDLRVMLLAQAPYLTIDALTAYSGGKITPRMIDFFLGALNVWRFVSRRFTRK